MADIKIRIENLAEFQQALGKSPQIVGKRLHRGIDRAGNVFLAGTKENIRSGRDMWKAPIDTGYMWNHIFLSVQPLKATIYPTADYATFVHDGTSKMQARPFFEITERTEQNEIERIFQEELANALEEISHA